MRPPNSCQVGQVADEPKEKAARGLAAADHDEGNETTGGGLDGA
jgi:hypothetical protein